MFQVGRIQSTLVAWRSQALVDAKLGGQSETSPEATGLGPAGGPSISEIGCTALIFGGVDAHGQPADNDKDNV